MERIWPRVDRTGRLAGLAAALGAFALAAAAPADAATVLTGGWQSSCGPATCFNDKGVYSITFSASAFSGPVDVSRLMLDRALFGSMSNQFFSLSFQLGGQSLGAWGNWNMGAVPGDELWFFGPDVIWNPADGDLVLVLELVAPNGEKLGASGAGGWGFSYQEPQGQGGASNPVSTLDQLGSAQPGDDAPSGQGPGGSAVTGGDSLTQDTAPGPIPEPAAWLLAIGGLGLAGAALRRQRGAATV